MPADFFQTPMGRQFYEGTMRRVATGLEELSKEQKRTNDLKEFKIAQKMSDKDAIELFPNNELIKKMVEKRTQNGFDSIF